MESGTQDEQGSGAAGRKGGGTVVWAIVVWARVVLGLGLGTAGGIAFGHAWTHESAPLWWVGAISLLTGILVLLSGLYARSRPPGATPDFVAQEESPAVQEPLVPLLGALLVYKFQRITHGQLEEALARQRKERKNRRRVGEILMAMEAISRTQLEEALEYQRSVMREKLERAGDHAAGGQRKPAGDRPAQ